MKDFRTECESWIKTNPHYPFVTPPEAQIKAWNKAARRLFKVLKVAPPPCRISRGPAEKLSRRKQKRVWHYNEAIFSQSKWMYQFYIG